MIAQEPKYLTAPATIRTYFSRAISEMYRTEVPLYGTLVQLVAEVNREACRGDRNIARRIEENGESERLSLERHGAIRLGTAHELSWIRRLFAVMDMHAVAYYDLSVAGVPVHSTAFRPLTDSSLRNNPLRMFTSLLRPEQIADAELRSETIDILSKREIFTDECKLLIALAERDGGLEENDAKRFVSEALETFRWHGDATVTAETYQRLHRAHPLVADVVCFRGPHINHLTPRTLDIDQVQALMPASGITPKAVIEGPPRRKVPILLRQTSFRALVEQVSFRREDGGECDGLHTARFGEVEQRGAALTRKGKALYDGVLSQARAAASGANGGIDAARYQLVLAEHFAAFPDDETVLRKQGLAFFRYRCTDKLGTPLSDDIDDLIAEGYVVAEPITYEDFLPVSAAGIFQSNLGEEPHQTFERSENQVEFEAALGVKVIDEIDLYEKLERDSKTATLAAFQVPAPDK